jgi:hypothetical protein
MPEVLPTCYGQRIHTLLPTAQAEKTFGHIGHILLEVNA